jgi:hypothetical protein
MPSGQLPEILGVSDDLFCRCPIEKLPEAAARI